MMAQALFASAEMALFNGTEQVADWIPFDPVENTRYLVTIAVEVTHMTVRATDGNAWIDTPAVILGMGTKLVESGGWVQAPPLSEWIVAANF